MLCLMFSRLDSACLSLQEIAHDLGLRFDCSISKQSIDKRFSSRSVKFFKQLLSEAMRQKLSTNFPKSYLSKFNSVRIQDSTSFQVPASLKESYGGCGGCTTGALVRIQFEYDLKENGIHTFDFSSGSKQDVSYAKQNKGNINKGDLIIRDLGYSSKEVFLEIDSKEAFYISKLRSKQIVYTADINGKYKRVCFCKLYAQLQAHPKTTLETEVYLDKKGKSKSRLILEKIPSSVYESRIRKASKDAKKKGRELSEEYKLRNRMNVHITNTDSESIPCELIRKVYCIRWQIELIFKAWKSSLGIDNVKQMKKERFETQLLAKLLLIVITLKIYTAINSFKVSVDKAILSYRKYMQNIFNVLETFMICIRDLKIKAFIEKIILLNIQKPQEVEMKKGKLSSIHSLLLLSSEPDILRFRS